MRGEQGVGCGVRGAGYSDIGDRVQGELGVGFNVRGAGWRLSGA